MMVSSRYAVPRMDCSSEERMVRLALEDVEGIERLRFDLQAREVTIRHDGPVGDITAALEPLGLGARLEETGEADEEEQQPDEDPESERRVLRKLLAINGFMFFAELGFGLWAQSTGLIADSLDMFADAMVYALSLYAVGRADTDKKRSARASGWLQMLLAIGALVEVGRRALVGSEPSESTMIGVGALALVANFACVALLARHRKGGVHLKASWIFSTNDMIANIGIILAGVLVWVTGSAVPDLILGTAVGLLVLSGAVRILRL